MFCNTCKCELPEEHFTKNGIKKKKCKACVKEANKKYREQNSWALYLYEKRRNSPERYAKYKTKRRAKKYGLTEEQYNQMYLSQEGMCAICGKDMCYEAATPGKGANADAACIDHCHTTNNVRGLLCQQCNIGLGAFKDSVESLKKAIEYLNEKVKGVIK